MAGWRKSGGSGGKRPDDASRGDSGKGGSEPGGHSRRPARPASGAPEPVPSSRGKSSWRKKSTAASTTPSDSGDRYYRRTGGFFGFLFGRRQKLWMLGCTFSLLLAYVVWTMLNEPTAVPIVAVAVTRYVDPLIPQNFTASRNLERLENLASQTRDFRCTPLHEKTSQSDFKTAFKNALKTVVPGGRRFRRKSVIIYVSAHGVVDQNDKPCLLLTDSKPVDEKTWYPLSDLLEAIKRETRFENATKLLVLDCCRIRSEWRMGILDNRFVKVLHQALAEVDDPNLCILTSANSGERAWSAPDLGGGTGFGDVLVEGLRGAAGKHQPERTAGFADFIGQGSGQVGDLGTYLDEQVNHWAAATRSCEQHPQLITPRQTKVDSSKAVLAWVIRKSSSGKKPEGEPGDKGAAKKAREALEKFWARHELLARQRTWIRHPVGWAEFELHLLRLEELYLDRVGDPTAVNRASDAVEE